MNKLKKHIFFVLILTVLVALGAGISASAETPAAPTGVTFVFNDTNHPYQAVLTGLDETMEFRLLPGGSWTAFDGTVAAVEIIDNMPQFYQIRRAETETSPAGVPTHAIIPARRLAPSIALYTYAEQFSNLTIVHEMSIGGGAYTRLTSDAVARFTSGTALSELIDTIPPGQNMSVRFRLSATQTLPPSVAIEFTLSARHGTPTAPDGLILNTMRERITGGTAGTNYQVSVDANEWENVTAASDGSFDISGLIAAYARGIHVRYAMTADAPPSGHVTVTLPGRLAAPEAPRFIFNHPEHVGMAVLIGLDEGMEFRLRTDANWTQFNGTDPASSLSGVSAQVRYRATETEFASNVHEVTMARSGSAPLIIFDRLAERLVGVTTNHEMIIDGVFTPFTEEMVESFTNGDALSALIDSIPLGQSLFVNIRYFATQDRPESHPSTHTLRARREAPTTVQFDDATFMLTGTTNQMQWSVQGSDVWTNINGTSVNLNHLRDSGTEIVILVRFRALVYVASWSISFSLPESLPITTPDGLILDTMRERITGGTAGRNYQISLDAIEWEDVTAASDGSFDISGLITSADRTLYVRESGGASHASITILGRPEAPESVSLIYNHPNHTYMAVLTGLNESMEFRLITAQQWTRFTGENPVFNLGATVQVRYSATESAFVSAITELRALSRSIGVPIGLDRSTQRLTGVTTSHEWHIWRPNISIGLVPFEPVTDEVLEGLMHGETISDLIDTIESGERIHLRFRLAATRDTPSSLSWDVQLVSRPAAPTTVQFDAETFMLTGVTQSMQWSVQGSGTWTNVRGASVDLLHLRTNDADIVVLVRFFNTANAASHPVSFTLPRTVAPTPSDMFVDTMGERIVGGTRGVRYEHSFDAVNWTEVTVGNDGSFSITSLITTDSRELHIRESGAASYATITIPGRPAAPEVPRFIFNHPDHVNRAVLIGLDEGMEFRLSSAANWTQFNGIYPAFAVHTQIVHVRYMATSAAFASEAREIAMPTRPPVPNVSLDRFNEWFYNVSTTQELVVDGIVTRLTDEMIEDFTSGSTISDLIDTVAPGERLSFGFRLAATEDLPSSNGMIVISLNARRADPPTTVTFCADTFRLTGATVTMQWSVQGSNIWTRAANVVDLSHLMGSDTDIVVLVRHGAGVQSASWPVSFTLPAATPAPDGLVLDDVGEYVSAELNDILEDEAEDEALPETEYAWLEDDEIHILINGIAIRSIR